jgi:hypothetical protein
MLRGAASRRNSEGTHGMYLSGHRALGAYQKGVPAAADVASLASAPTCRKDDNDDDDDDDEASNDSPSSVWL